MLKHTSNAGGPANGQLRINAPAAARNIHLRPQQPLNVSTLSASSLQQSAANSGTLANGGQRIPTTLLNIVSSTGPPPPSGTATTATTTPVTPITPITPIVPNGIGNNLHTYTNQHISVGSYNSNTNNNNNNNGTNHNYSNCNNLTGVHVNTPKHGPGPREALTSLGLLCLVSLLLALLSLIFLLKISPNGREDALSRSSTEDFVVIYDVTLALCALSLSLNLCCLLVCAIQFLFAVKLVRSPMFDGRDNKYLEKSSASRTCAVGGFFISIPIFLTGIILYTFNHFHSTPAIITSVLIGIGIVFCGGAMVHNVFVWQKEKTISYRSPPMNMSLISHIGPITPPVQFLNHQPNHINFNQSNSTLLHPTSVTPVSPNHSHGSFNPLVSGGLGSSFLMRPSTATPPTPKPIVNGGCLTLNGATNGGCGSGTSCGGGTTTATGTAVISGGGGEASGSVSPGLPPTLDISTITNTSLHELSTLV